MVPNTPIHKLISKNTLFNMIYVTDMGYYPQATSHYVERERGSSEYIIFYCADGKGWYETDRGYFEVYPNQFFILPSNQKHRYGAHADDPWSIYWIMFSGKFSDDLSIMNALKHYFKPNTLLQSAKYLELYEDMFNMLSEEHTIDNIVFSNMNLWLILMLFVQQKTAKKKRLKDTPVGEIINIMTNNIDRRLTINEMAAIVSYSPSHLYNLFKSHTGYSPLDYFIHLKVQRACNYLNNTNLRIKEIALLVGYNDPYLFTRIFTKVMGQSPQKYRSTIRV